MTRWSRNILAAYIGVVLALIVAADVEARRQTKVDAPVRAPSPTTQPDVVAGVDLSRVVIVFECANNGIKNPRGFDGELLKGWDHYFKTVVDPEIAWLKSRGVKRPRIMLHNPYGLEGADRNFAFSQRAACARDPKTRHLANGLRRQLERVIADGVDPIVYIGAFDGDPTTATKVTAATLEEWLYAVREILDAGAKPAFDYSHELPEASAENRFIELCGAIVPVLREPRLLKSRPDTHGTGVICIEAQWRRFDPVKYPDDSGKWAATREQHGEVILWLQYPDGTAGWNDRFPGDVAARLAAGARRVQADGDIAAVAPGWWRKR